MGQTRRRLLGGGLALVMVASLGAAAPGRDRDDLPPSIVYAYDELGRLKAATIPWGETAVYHYDQVGNLVEVERRSWDTMSVFSVVPARAVPGEQVVIHGAGFSPQGRYQVQVGDVPAEVTEVSEYELTVTVPAAAASGPVRVRSGGVEARGEVALQVTGDRAPVVDAFHPSVVTPGDRITVQGQRFTGDATVDAVVLGDSMYATVASASATELVATVPPAAFSGQLSVATPDGTAHATDQLLVLPWDEYPVAQVTSGGQMSPGAAVPVEVADDGTATAFTFTGAAGQRLTLAADGELSCFDLAIGLAGPAGSLRDPDDRSDWCGGGDPEAVVLPADGTYTLVVGARRGQAGQVGLRLAESAGPTPAPSPAATGGSPPPTSAPTPTPTPGSSASGQPAPSPDAGPSDGADVDLPQQLFAGAEPFLDGAAVAPVDLSSGPLAVQHTDLIVDDLLPVALTRTYQPVNGRVTSRDVYEFGLGSGLEYALTLRLSSALQFADLVLPDGNEVPFERVTEGRDAQDAVFEPLPTGGPFDHSRITLDGGQWRLQMADGAALRFDNRRQAQLVAVQDAAGNAITIDRERDRLGRPGPVEAVYSPSGHRIAFDYDDEERITRAYDHAGREVTYRYDEEGLLIRAESSTGDVIGYEYDEGRRVRQITDADGASVLEVEYDENDRVVAQQLADGSELTFAYELVEEVVEVERPNGEVAEAQTEAVVAAELTDAAGTVRRVEFEDGRWMTDTYGAGTEQAQTFRVDRDPDNGFVTATEDPDGTRTAIEYDDNGRPVRLVAGDDGDEPAAYQLEYDPVWHEPTSIIGPGGAVQQFAYDDAGNPVRHTGPDGASTRYAYDAQGRLTELTDPDGHTTRIEYEMSHRVRVADPDGHTYQEFFDKAGQLVAVTDATGATTRIEYDGAGQPIVVTDPAGGQTEMRYDGGGNLAAITDPAGNTTTYDADGSGLVVERTDATGATDRYTYDAFGRPVEHVDRRGVRTTHRYDALGRLVEVGYGADGDGDGDGDAESTVAFKYDEADRLVAVNDSAYGTVELEYDQQGRLTAETTPQGRITYAYDDADRRVAMTLPDGTVTSYGYDEAGQLSSVDNGEAEVAAERERERRWLVHRNGSDAG